MNYLALTLITSAAQLLHSKKVLGLIKAEDVRQNHCNVKKSLIV